MWYTIIGLGLDIIGVILLFRYGVLPRRLFDSLLRDHTIDDWKVNRNHRFSAIGLTLLICGFFLQIMGTLDSYNYLPF